MRDGRGHVDGDARRGRRLERQLARVEDGAAGRPCRLDHVGGGPAAVAAGQPLLVEEVPGAAVRKPRDRLREVVLRPRDLRRRDLAPVVGEDARPAAVELRERDEVLLADPRRRRRQRATVELVEPGGQRGSARAGEVERRPVAPRVRTEQQAPLLGETSREAAAGEQERRPVAGAERRVQLDVAREQRRDRPRVVPPADGPRIPGLRPDRLGAERLEPGERVVEPLPDEPLERCVAARALGSEVVPLAVPPDDAARQEHRAARAGPLLDHARPQAELARTRGGDQPRHPRAGDDQLR